MLKLCSMTVLFAILIIGLSGCDKSDDKSEVKTTKIKTNEVQEQPNAKSETDSIKEKKVKAGDVSLNKETIRVAKPIPSILDGWIEAEDYDEGGEGVGFHDLTIKNLGDYKDRRDAVDIRKFNDTGVTVKSVQKDEWLAYTVKIPAPGIFLKRTC